MMQKKILYSAGPFWVTPGPKHGYEVYQNTGTHAVRCAVIGYTGDKGLQRAITEADERNRRSTK